MTLSLFALVCLAWQSPAQEPVTWEKHIRPMLAESCLLCHGPDPSTREADLRLDNPAGYLADLGGYSAVAPGDLDESELIYRLTTDDERERMPPVDSGEALSAEQIELFKRWIEQGAEWQEHWAYAPARDVEMPQLAATGSHPIDAFIQAKLAELGMSASPPAKPAIRLRRVYLDLIGLPPSPQQLAEFSADPSDAHYEQIVDELLASEQFAVRWARPWLDAARYADSHGFTIDGGRTAWPWRDWVVDAIHSDMPFDQFTIEQLAGDLLPEATRAQRLATGFHRNTQINQEGGAKDEENRVNAVLDRVNTTGAVWLGSTFGCAQCHTHKYDPITHTDYFSLFAFFNQTRDSGVSSDPALLVARNAEEERSAAAWEATAAQRAHAVRVAHARATPAWTTWQPRAWGSNGPELRPEEDGSYFVVGQNPVYSTYFLEGKHSGALAALRLEALADSRLPKGGPGRAGNGNFVLQELRVFARPSSDDTQEDWRAVALKSARADFEQDTSADGGAHYSIQSVLQGGPGWAVKPEFGLSHVAQFELEDALPAGDWEVRVELQQELGGRHTLGAFRVALASDAAAAGQTPLIDSAWRAAQSEARAHARMRPALPRSLVMEEREVPRVTRLFNRGSFLDPRQVVQPAFPVAMNHFAADARPENRLDLARWLVDPRNALVHRVTVNRWWQQLFGLGLVETENDFGLRGAAPTHPDLLEWLAQDYVASGFSRKHVVRSIVTSATYQQSAVVTEQAYSTDPRNRWLARQSRQRLEGEVIRDAALQVSGLLVPKLGGPPVQPPQPSGVFSFTQSRKNWKASEGEDRYRRSLYTRLWRSSPFPFFTVFDQASASATCTRRLPSNTPLQALTLANDPMMLEYAAAFGAELALADNPWSEGYLRCLSRLPNEEELHVMQAFHARVAEQSGDQAAWTALARVLLNLDEFVNRP